MRRQLNALAMVVLTASPAAAGGEARWSVSVEGGTDVEISGDVLLAGQGSIAGLGAGTESLSYATAFGPSFRGAVSIGYRVSPRLEAFLRGGRYSMDGQSVPIGGVSGLDLAAEVGRYQEWSAEAGLRRFFVGRGGFEPYVAVSGGVRSLKAMTLTLSVPDAGLNAADLPLYDQSLVAVVGADAGVLRRVSSHLSLGIEVGFRYQAAPKGLEAGLQGSGLDSLNDGGSRWSLPVSARATLRF
jgi:hypothetical protein